ncbi:MAG: hypothetical protein ACK5LK_06225 [Chthoniobacterales bacterium]
MQFFFILLATLALSATPPNEDQVRARKAAIGLASALKNEGFKARDGVFYGDLVHERAQVFSVYLFEGSIYWFCAASADPLGKIQIRLFDEGGALLPVRNYEAEALAACGVQPKKSGLYYLKVSGDLPESAKTIPFAVVYSFK